MDLGRLKEALDNRSELTARNRVLLSSVDSTNKLALRLVRLFLSAETPPPRFYVVALHQQAGRGRLGRKWVSPPGGGSYLSVAVPVHGPNDLASLPLLIAAGLCRRISELTESSCLVKWPNDLMLEGRKVGGILIDCVSRGSLRSAAVIGVGVNYAKSRSLSELGGIAMDEVNETLPGLAEVSCELLAAVEDALTHMGELEYAADRFRESSAHREGDELRYRTGDGVQSGVFSGLDSKGRLVLRVGDEEVRLSAGEAVESWTGGGP